DYTRLADNFRYLREHTGVHIHADLIVGLPGETVETFAAGFDRLVALQPQEIQVGILKRLRGTPIVRHDLEFQMLYHAEPPYEILQNRDIDFAMLQRMRRFAKYWDLVGNSGNFVATTPLIWSGLPSPFYALFDFSDWLFAKVRRTDTIALMRLMELLFDYLTQVRRLEPSVVAPVLWSDYQRGGRFDKPGFLKDHLPSEPGPSIASRRSAAPKRQSRHMDAPAA
ncbi:MAG TPA: DUF4080 domain-containing protein, partial [Roseimicrobium sp.]|nr:DUF4080 domain-containing protein [Roseimicrobium sp.]